MKYAQCKLKRWLWKWHGEISRIERIRNDLNAYFATKHKKYEQFMRTSLAFRTFYLQFICSTYFGANIKRRFDIKTCILFIDTHKLIRLRRFNLIAYFHFAIPLGHLRWLQLLVIHLFELYTQKEADCSLNEALWVPTVFTTFLW